MRSSWLAIAGTVWVLAAPPVAGMAGAAHSSRGGAVVRRHLARADTAGLLLLPFKEATAASATYCFGLKPWSAAGEAHSGIDVVAAHRGVQPTMLQAAIVAPVGGTVEWVVPGTTGDGLASVLVLIRMNAYWFVSLTFEPQSASQATNDAQLAAIQVTPGQAVSRGQTVGDLVVWNVKDGSYPHVHLGFLYKHPLESLEHVRDHILEVAVSNGLALPPTSGSGSPGNPTDLGIPTTFFCPCAFSTAAARAVYAVLPALAATGAVCACPCAYGSTAGGCGTCQP